MDSYFVEIQRPFSPPSSDARLVLIADDEMHRELEDVKRHLFSCVKYAKKHSVYVVTGLFAHEGNLCLCLLDPNGEVVCRQPAIHLAMPLHGEFLPGDRIEVVHAGELGNVCLCVDCDINDPRVLRAAALKGADVALSVQALDPVQDAGERLLRTVWSGAQGNNLYVVNIAAGSAAVACPAGVTRAGDGYLIRQTSTFPVRFGLNMARLDEIRRGLRLLEQINPALIANYEAELGR